MVSDSSPGESRGGGNNDRQPRFSTYTEWFDYLLPYYLSIGMSYEQFMDEDPWLVKAFHKAEEMRAERENQKLWLQGLYVYNAIVDVAPILHPFSKAKKPNPYPSEPYPLNTSISEKRKEEKRREDDKKFIDYMNAWAENINRKMAKKA